MTITSEDLERGDIGFRDESYRRGWFRNGEFTAAEGIDIDAIKRQYSNEAVERASKQYGFTAKKTADNKYRLTRRAY